MQPKPACLHEQILAIIEGRYSKGWEVCTVAGCCCIKCPDCNEKVNIEEQEKLWGKTILSVRRNQ